MTPTRDQLQQWLNPERAIKLWAKFQRTKSGCLEWTRAKSPDGYGIFYPMIDGKECMVQVHRAIYVLENGNIEETDKVRHFICENRPCSNIKHLNIGTQADNMTDKVGMNYNGNADKHPNYRSHVRSIKQGRKWNDDHAAVLAEANERLARSRVGEMVI
jgi:hypothetical protein